MEDSDRHNFMTPSERAADTSTHPEESAFFCPPSPRSPSKEPYCSQQPVGGSASTLLTSFLVDINPAMSRCVNSGGSPVCLWMFVKGKTF